MDINAKRAPARERVLDVAQSVIRDGASRPSSNLAVLCDDPRHAKEQLAGLTVAEALVDFSQDCNGSKIRWPVDAKTMREKLASEFSHLESGKGAVALYTSETTLRTTDHAVARPLLG